MTANKLQWKRIAKGDRLPCDSLLMKKDGTIPSVVSGAGVKVGQDAYYLPVEELKSFPKEESEDEKTKRLLHTIAYKIGQHLRDIFTEEEYQCFDAWSNAWLEKQGEPKEINPSEFDSQLNRLLGQFKSLPKEELAGILNFYLNVVRNDGTYKEEKQGEQKHQYNSRPRYVGEEELLGTNKQGKCPFSKQELIDKGFAFTQDGDLAYPIHKIEKKEFAAWSEEDIKTLEGIVCILDGIRYYNTVDSKQEKPYQSEIDWLKSLKYRVQPQLKQEWKQENIDNLIDFEIAMMHIGDSFFGQHAGLDPNDTNAIKEQANILLGLVPKQEWSEEDKTMLCYMEGHLEYLKNDKGYSSSEDQIMLKRQLDWLNSLKDRFTWKPSDEQMNGLKEAIEFLGCTKTSREPLQALYEQLKKLRRNSYERKSNTYET